MTRSFLYSGTPNGSFTPTALRVVNSGILRMEDMLSSPLEGNSVDWGITQMIVRALERAANMNSSSSYFSSRQELFGSVVRQLTAISEIEQDASHQQFILSHDGSRFRVSPFALWGADSFVDMPLADGSRWVARTNVLEPVSDISLFSEESLVHLESLINSDAWESEFQIFFERYPQYLLALGPYTKLHPQLVLAEDNGGKLIPDFFLEKIDSDFSDICDLKRPTAELVRYQRHRDRFRDAVMEAVAQLATYRDWFDDPSHRYEFRNRYGLDAFRPNVVIIIGRRNSYYQEVDRLKLESNLPRWVNMSTYDDVVSRARTWSKRFFS